MKDKKIFPKQFFALFLIIFLIANMILFALKKISGLVFWGVIIFAFILTYFFFRKEEK